VWLDGYYIDLHEVTNAEFERFQPTHVRNSSPRRATIVRSTTSSGTRPQAYCDLTDAWARVRPGRQLLHPADDLHRARQAG